ncbi:MAG: WbqC family protein [Bacteroidota bacterium]
MEPILLSTAYLPPISWMAVLLKAGNAGIEIHETYPKQTFRNRCIIASAAGILSLTVPVNKVNGNHTKTNEITTDGSANWPVLHWRSIVSAYNKAPYFLYYRDLFEPVYLKKYELLIDLNQALLLIILKALKIKIVDLYFTGQYDKLPERTDLRNSFSPKQFPYQDLVFRMPRYQQVFEENLDYIPDLSIIDLIFNLGPDAKTYLETIEISDPDRLNAKLDTQS